MSLDPQTTCRTCRPTDVVANGGPFVDERSILQESHELISLARCKSCNSPWLHVCVEIYDEFWCYWAAMTESEVSRFTTQSDTAELDELLPIVYRIIRRGPVLEAHPLHGLGWKDGKHAMLEGPPW